MATSFTCFENLQTGVTSYAVTARGNVDLTIDPASTPGWQRVAQVQAKKGNLQATTIFATTAVFRNASAGLGETLIVNASGNTEFAGLDLGLI